MKIHSSDYKVIIFEEGKEARFISHLRNGIVTYISQ